MAGAHDTTTLPDGVKAITVYAARDGREFHSLIGAQHHNQDLEKAEAGNQALVAGATVYDAALAAGYRSPPEILRRVTADTPLVISHWQCRDTPGYKVVQFEAYDLYVAGDAGAWSGSYGSKVGLQDLARYAEDTFRRYPDIPSPSSMEAGR